MESMNFNGHDKPEWPPRRVWREVDEAALVWEDLQAQGCELHFEIDEDSGRLIIEMRELDGEVLGPVSPSEVLKIASGSPAPLK